MKKLHARVVEVREALYALKFALEQDSSGPGIAIAVQLLRRTLDLANTLQKQIEEYMALEASGLAGDSNPLLVDTLSNSLKDPFTSEPPTNVVIKNK